MGLPDLYPAQVGSPYTTLAAPYTSGEGTMTLVDATKLPTAPNIVCLAGSVAGEFRYTGKDGNILQGVAALPGTPAATTWSAGTYAFRGIAAYDLDCLGWYADTARTALRVPRKVPSPAIEATASSMYENLEGASGSHATNGILQHSAATGGGWLSKLDPVDGEEWLQYTITRCSSRRIVCIGDSITQGAPLHSPSQPSQHGRLDDEMSSYEAYLRIMMPGWDIVNKGVGSNTTGMMLARFAADVVALRPRAVIINGYGNDIGGGVASEVTIQNIKDMCALAVNAGILPVITSSIPWNTGTESKLDQLDSIRHAIQIYAAENGYPFVDFYHAMEDPGNPRKMPASYTADGVHPSVTGYRIMASAIDPSDLTQGVTPRALRIYSLLDPSSPPRSYHIPTRIRVDINDEDGGVYDLADYGQLAENNYEGIFFIPLPPQRPATGDTYRIRITILNMIKWPLAAGTHKYTGFAEVEVYE